MEILRVDRGGGFWLLLCGIETQPDSRTNAPMVPERGMNDPHHRDVDRIGFRIPCIITVKRAVDSYPSADRNLALIRYYCK